MRKAGIALVALAAVVASAMPAWAQYPPAEPTCQTNKSVVQPGETIQVSGQNWQENSSVRARFRQDKLDEEYGPFPTDADGDFSGSVTIPATAHDGPARLVVGGPNQSGERVRCIVQLTVEGGGPPPEPGATVCAVDDATPAPGQTVKVSGRHWLERSEAEITFEQGSSSQPLGVARVNGAGRFGKTVTIPGTADDGPAEIVVTGFDDEGNPETCRIEIVVTSSSTASAGFDLAPPVTPANLGMLVLVAGTIALTRRRRTRSLLAR